MFLTLSKTQAKHQMNLLNILAVLAQKHQENGVQNIQPEEHIHRSGWFGGDF